MSSASSNIFTNSARVIVASGRNVPSGYPFTQPLHTAASICSCAQCPWVSGKELSDGAAMAAGSSSAAMSAPQSNRLNSFMCFPPFGALLTPFNYKDRKSEKVQPTFSKFAKKISPAEIFCFSQEKSCCTFWVLESYDNEGAMKQRAEKLANPGRNQKNM